MKPAIVLPMSDLDGIIFRHLHLILTDLKTLFRSAIISIPPETQRRQTANIKQLKSDSFFDVLLLPEFTGVGEQFLALYSHAAQICSPTQILHLCYPDRVSYALQGPYRAQFIHDMRYLDNAAAPIIYQRSDQAWKTHPTNYRKLESLVTEMGEVLFGQNLEFAWCHLALIAQDLQRILPKVTHPGMAMVAEIVLQLRKSIKTRDVDWLAWEDPYILDQDPIKLKTERENSRVETHKRLGYVIPMLQILADAYERSKRD